MSSLLPPPTTVNQSNMQQSSIPIANIMDGRKLTLGDIEQVHDVTLIDNKLAFILTLRSTNNKIKAYRSDINTNSLRHALPFTSLYNKYGCKDINSVHVKLLKNNNINNNNRHEFELQKQYHSNNNNWNNNNNKIVNIFCETPPSTTLKSLQQIANKVNNNNNNNNNINKKRKYNQLYDNKNKNKYLKNLPQFDLNLNNNINIQQPITTTTTTTGAVPQIFDFLNIPIISNNNNNNNNKLIYPPLSPIQSLPKLLQQQQISPLLNSIDFSLLSNNNNNNNTQTTALTAAALDRNELQQLQEIFENVQSQIKKEKEKNNNNNNNAEILTKLTSLEPIDVLNNNNNNNKSLKIEKEEEFEKEIETATEMQPPPAKKQRLSPVSCNDDELFLSLRLKLNDILNVHSSCLSLMNNLNTMDNWSSIIRILQSHRLELLRIEQSIHSSYKLIYLSSSSYSTNKILINKSHKNINNNIRNIEICINKLQNKLKLQNQSINKYKNDLNKLNLRNQQINENLNSNKLKSIKLIQFIKTIRIISRKYISSIEKMQKNVSQFEPFYYKWNTRQVITYFENINKGSLNKSQYFLNFKKELINNNIRGKDLSKLNNLSLKLMGLKNDKERWNIIKYLNKLLKHTNQSINIVKKQQ